MRESDVVARTTFQPVIRGNQFCKVHLQLVYNKFDEFLTKLAEILFRINILNFLPELENFYACMQRKVSRDFLAYAMSGKLHCTVNKCEFYSICNKMCTYT